MNSLQSVLGESMSQLDKETHGMVSNYINGLRTGQITILENALKNAPTLQKAYELLGREAGAGALGKDSLTEGKRLFNNLRANIRSSICNNLALRVYCEKANVANDYIIAALVLEGLLRDDRAAASVALLSVVATRIGINLLCSEIWIGTPGSESCPSTKLDGDNAPSGPYTYDAFLSFALEDIQAATDLFNELNSYKLKIWFSKAHLDSGDSLISTVNEAIPKCKFGIFLLSTNTFETNDRFQINEIKTIILLHNNYRKISKIFSVHHGIDHEYVVEKHPFFFSDNFTRLNTKDGPKETARKIHQAITKFKSTGEK